MGAKGGREHTQHTGCPRWKMKLAILSFFTLVNKHKRSKWVKENIAAFVVATLIARYPPPPPYRLTSLPSLQPPRPSAIECHSNCNFCSLHRRRTIDKKRIKQRAQQWRDNKGAGAQKEGKRWKSGAFGEESGGKARADSQKQTINSEIIPCIPLEKVALCNNSAFRNCKINFVKNDKDT